MLEVITTYQGSIRQLLDGLAPQSDRTQRFSMPIKWYGTSNKEDPTYQHFARIVNLTLHGMAFAALNSGLWFIQKLRSPWEHLNWFTEAWLIVLAIHLAVVISRKPSEKSQAEELS